MANNIDQDLLDEIRFDIKVKDLMKGQLVLAALELVKRDTQKKALLEVARAEEDFAVPLLAGVFVNAPNIAQSFPHLKETMYAKVLSRPEVLLDLLAKNSDSKTTSFLAGIAGEIRLGMAVPILLDIMTSTTEVRTIEAVITALGLIGNPVAVKPISAHLHSPAPQVVTAAVKALGELATAEAIQRLWEVLGKDPVLDHTILDIFSKAQTPLALEKLNATLVSKHAHVRNTGKQKLGEVGAMSVRVLLKNLSQNDPDLIIHSLNVLGDINDSAAIPAIRKLLHDGPEDANIRFAAYEALGRFPIDKGAITLATGLEDPVDNVRTAAAMAIDRNYNALLSGGIRNLTSSGGDTALKIIETIINSQCEKIFFDLLEEDYFQPIALDLLMNKAHSEIRSYYIKTLASKGFTQLAEQIASGKAVEGKSRRRVFAVDDSKMILNIYRTVLHNLGFDSTLFEFSNQILEQVQKEKPDAILTDLNMPEITGIELTTRLRELYSKEELPIIMVTTQDEAQDIQELLSSGINGILRKPFTESQISKAFKKFAGLAAKA
jgi:CheY-like chemotaxis protein/HEAT repeat protein